MADPSPRLDTTSYTDANGVTVGGSPVVDTTGVRTPQVATTPAPASNPTAAPPVATAAPSKTIFTGLCTALNATQQALKEKGQIAVPDQYEIIFNPTGLIGSATIAKPGGVVQANTPMNQEATAAAKLDPAKSSVNATSYTVPVYAGTQIVQFIDEVIKSSSYITDQASIIIDKDTGKMRPNANTKNGQMAWYKVNVAATPLGYDNLRKQDAYKMTFLITPFSISEMESQYFPQSNFRGVHKSYNYWFTGLNNSVLNFEQDYNYLFKQVFTASISPGTAAQSDSRDFYQKTWAVASSESSKGAANAANEVGANAADWMYNARDLANIKLKIVGDPAWLQQGEITQGVTPANFSYQPFLTDGTINFDSQQTCFDVSWNAPTDYNFDTGIADVTVNNVNKTTTNLPQENFTYNFIECFSTFNKGRFEQEIVGKLIINPLKKAAATTSAATTTAAPTNVPAGIGNMNSAALAPTGSNADTAIPSGVRDPNVAAGAQPVSENTNTTTGDASGAGDAASIMAAAANGPAQILPAANPTAPTSNGSIVGIEQAGPPVAAASTTAQIARTLGLPAQALAGAVLGGTPLSLPSQQSAGVNSTPQNMNIEK